MGTITTTTTNNTACRVRCVEYFPIYPTRVLSHPATRCSRASVQSIFFNQKTPHIFHNQQQLGSSEEQCIQHPFSVPWKMQTLIQDQTFNIQRDGGYRKKSHCDFLMTIYTREWYYFLRGRCGQMLFIRKGWRVNCPIYLRSPHHKTRSLNPTTNWTPV